MAVQFVGEVRKFFCFSGAPRACDKRPTRGPLGALLGRFWALVGPFGGSLGPLLELSAALLELF
eukprot:528558-Pyramimonas_sp.AAC.1